MCGGNGGVLFFFFKEIKWMITVFGLHIMKMKKLFLINVVFLFFVSWPFQLFESKLLLACSTH